MASTRTTERPVSFGPYKLLKVQPEGDSLVLHLGDEDGNVLYRPRRFLSFSNTEATKKYATSLIGSMVVTETSNPAKNSPEKWWVSVRRDAQSTVEVPRERHKIVGPPGTGKTYELIERVKNQVGQGVSTDKVAFLTFTNNAANTARTRVLEAFPNKRSDDFPYFCTLHSLATRIGGCLDRRVMTHSEREEFDPSIKVEEVWMKQGDPSSAEERPDHAALSLLSLARARCISLEKAVTDSDLKSSDLEQQIRDFFLTRRGVRIAAKGLDLVRLYLEQYDAFKAERRLVDFDDVIANAQAPSFEPRIPSFDVLIVDEAQDLSDLQWRFVERLMTKAKYVVVAGDDDQAIMVPFGASPDAFLRFEGAKHILKQSRRVPGAAYKYVMDRTLPLLKAKFPQRIPKDWEPTGLEGEVLTHLEKPASTAPTGGTSAAIAASERVKLKHLLSEVKRCSTEEWLLMAPTKKTCQKISKGLKALRVPHYLRNRPELDAEGAGSKIRIMSIHTSKGDEADNVALVVATPADWKMINADPRLAYVAQTRARRRLFPEVPGE
jgi:superfamily I DNA/RNA helicase